MISSAIRRQHQHHHRLLRLPSLPLSSQVQVQSQSKSQFHSARSQLIPLSRPCPRSHQLSLHPFSSSLAAARNYATMTATATTTATTTTVPTIEASAEKFYVPTIDIAPFLANPNSPEAADIVSRVRAACISTGFFQIVNHGLPRELQTAVFDAAGAFFALPFEEKKELDAKTHLGHRGYDVLASQSYEEGVLPDLKEGFYVGTEVPLSDPKAQARRFFMGPNVWPSFSHLPASAFRDPVLAYYDAVYTLSLRVLDLIAATLPYGPRVFDEFTSNTPAAPLRLLHYPPAPPSGTGADGSRQLGASAHTDFGAITLLLQDTNPGLEVLDQTSNEWVPIPPGDSEGGYVVNVGDMLSAWTGGAYRSSVHRVLNKNPGKDRFSVVFFFDGNLDTKLAPMDVGLGKKEGEGQGNVLTVEQHMLKRMQDSYGKEKK